MIKMKTKKELIQLFNDGKIESIATYSNDYYRACHIVEIVYGIDDKVFGYIELPNGYDCNGFRTYDKLFFFVKLNYNNSFRVHGETWNMNNFIRKF